MHSLWLCTLQHSVGGTHILKLINILCSLKTQDISWLVPCEPSNSPYVVSFAGLTWQNDSTVLVKLFSRWFFANKKNKYQNYSFETLWPNGGHNDLIFHVMFHTDTLSTIIIMRLYQICLLKVSLVGSFKHLPDSRGTQITAYFCMQFASKSSPLISCIIHVSYEPISVSFWVVKMCKIQRENILKRPIPVQ